MGVDERFLSELTEARIIDGYDRVIARYRGDTGAIVEGLMTEKREALQLFGEYQSLSQDPELSDPSKDRLEEVKDKLLQILIPSDEEKQRYLIDQIKSAGEDKTHLITEANIRTAYQILSNQIPVSEDPDATHNNSIELDGRLEGDLESFSRYQELMGIDDISGELKIKRDKIEDDLSKLLTSVGETTI